MKIDNQILKYSNMKTFFRINIIIILTFVSSLNARDDKLVQFINDRWIHFGDSNIVAVITNSSVKNSLSNNINPLTIEQIAIGKCNISLYESQIYKYQNAFSVALVDFDIDLLPTLFKIISNLPKLTSITFVSMQIETLPNEFKLLTKLEEIEFNECKTINNIDNIPDNLHNICFYNSYISSFPDNSFKKNLKVIALEIKDLNTLPKNIENIQSVEEVYLFCQNLSKVKFDFSSICRLKKLKKMKKFELRGIDLNSSGIPDCIFQLENLQSLSLENDMLSSIDSGMLNLKNLKELNLSFNNFTSILNIFFEIKNLTDLDLESNQISDFIPESVFYHGNIRRLNMINNPLTLKSKDLLNKYLHKTRIRY